MRKLTINRNAWHRGTAGVFLTSIEGQRQQCAVGAYLSSLGVTDANLYKFDYDSLPAEARWISELHKRLGFLHSSDLAQRIFEANDTPNVPDRVREEHIRELFAKVDVDVEFVNGPPIEQPRRPVLINPYMTVYFSSLGGKTPFAKYVA